jgi:tRNA (adenine22-N1)-methyltransferase
MAAASDRKPPDGRKGRRVGPTHTAKQHSDPALTAPRGDAAAQPALRVPHTPGKRTQRPPLLDARLRAAADWVAPCGVCADIGCDHGRLGTALLLENRCHMLLAADVSAKALAKASTRIAAQGLESRTVFAAADGLDALAALPDGRADTVCILGMGGETLAGILTRGQSCLRGARLVLGAQTELPLLRKTLCDIGYRLRAERVIQADGRLYILMLALPAASGAPAYTERQLLLGPCLLATLPPEWTAWLARRRTLLQTAVAALQNAQAEAHATRLAALRQELRWTDEALAALAQKSADSAERDDAP